MAEVKESKQVVFFVAGIPQPQSRARVTKNGVYSSAGRPLKAWRVSVATEIAKIAVAPLKSCLAGALEVRLTFNVPTNDKKRWGMWCYVKPDFDNYAKAVVDVMEDAGLFAVGDGQVASAHISKIWTPRAEAGCLVRLSVLDTPPEISRETMPDWLKA